MLLRLALPALLFPLPALAHPGAHLHPHGAEPALGLLLLAALAGAGALGWRRARVRTRTRRPR